MRIVVHDYAGHAFPIALSRWLAASGHDVLHLYSKDIQSPRGPVSPRANDTATLKIVGLTTGEQVRKYALVDRWRQERRFAALAENHISDFGPDVVLSGNGPPQLQLALSTTCRRMDVPFVYWLQDIYALGADRALPAGLRFLGAPFRALIRRVEIRALRNSTAVISISDDFAQFLPDDLTEPARYSVVRNWGCKDDIRPGPRRNSWSDEHDLSDRFVYLYAGTMGLKHDPRLIADLAEQSLRETEDRIVVVSEGPGRDWLQDEKQNRSLSNLVLLNFQDFDALPEILASADVLIVLLQPFAGVLSVPSKLLTYLCAGRPVLGAIPEHNLAAKIVADANAGITVDPSDPEGFVAAAHRMRGDDALRQKMGARARGYAEREFDMDTIGKKIETIFQNALQATRPTPQPKPGAGS